MIWIMESDFKTEKNFHKEIKEYVSEINPVFGDRINAIQQEVLALAADGIEIKFSMKVDASRINK